MGGVGGQQTGHVLDGDRVGPHVDQATGIRNIAFKSVDRADRIAERALSMLATGFDRSHGGFQVAQVIEGIEDPKDVDAVIRGLGDEAFHHVIGIVTIAEQILAPQQHLQGGVGQCFLELHQPLPWVFLEKAHTGIEGRPAPDLQRVETDGVKRRTYRQHVFGAQARRSRTDGHHVAPHR